MAIMTRLRTVASSVGAVTLAIGCLGLAVAPAAHAAVNPNPVQNLTAVASDGAVALTWTAPIANAAVLTSYAVACSGGPGTGVDPAGNAFPPSCGGFGVTGTTSLATSYGWTGLTNGVVYTFSVYAIAGLNDSTVAEVQATPNRAASSSGPQPSAQGLPLPGSGNCADITNDAVYAYGTGLSGGWTKHWGDWAHAWVCARTLTYSDGRWMIATS